MQIASSARKRKMDRDQINSYVSSLKLINSKLPSMDEDDRARALKTKAFIESELYAFDVQYCAKPDVNWKPFRPAIMEIIRDHLESGCNRKSEAIEKIHKLTGVSPCLETFRSWVRQYKNSTGD